MRKKYISARAETLPEDFAALGLSPDYISQREDGRRTDGLKGEFEWWYYDSKMADGTSLVVVFYSKSFTSFKAGLQPMVHLDLTRPDGRRLHAESHVEPTLCHFSADKCDVKIGNSTFAGDLHHYEIHVECDNVTADIVLDGNAPAWRPGTGRIRFGEKDYFAWLPSVPEGNTTAVITSAEGTETFSGTGYHDHNWGNTLILRLMHHWYWGRAKIGDYQVISSYLTGQKKYGYRHAPVFMLVKDGKLIGDEISRVHFTQTDAAFDEKTGKHYYKTLIYEYDAEDAHYKISYRMEDFLEQSFMGTDKQPLHFILGLMRLAPAYIRFTGTASIEKSVNGQITENVSNPAIWELMYFGLDADI